jgi:hypothetical protein
MILARWRSLGESLAAILRAVLLACSVSRPFCGSTTFSRRAGV